MTNLLIYGIESIVIIYGLKIIISNISILRMPIKPNIGTGGFDFMKSDNPQKNKYRAKYICDLLEISKKTLYDLEDRGVIPPVPRDWRNWRTYNDSHIKAIKKYQASKKKESS